MTLLYAGAAMNVSQEAGVVDALGDESCDGGGPMLRNRGKGCGDAALGDAVPAMERSEPASQDDKPRGNKSGFSQCQQPSCVSCPVAGMTAILGTWRSIPIAYAQLRPLHVCASLLSAWPRT